MYAFTVTCDAQAIAELRKLDTQLGVSESKTKLSVSQMEHSFASMGEKVKEVFSEIKGLVAGGLLAGGVFGGFEFLKSSKEMFDAMEKSITRVNTVLKSTNFAAGMSLGDVTGQAGDLNKVITQNRAEILDAQGMLLSFTGIKGPVFGETTKAVADFATFYKEDMTSAALQIGKALNDPAKGMNRLQRQGVAFTEEQKKQIKNYQEQGQLAKAQAVILKELHTEFGGQAAAYAGTDEGRVAMDAKGWENLKLEIGEIVSKIQISLLPVFAQMRDYVKEAFESGPVQYFLAHIKDLLSIGLKVIPMLAVYKLSMVGISVVTGAAALIQGIFGTAVVSNTTAIAAQKIVVSGFGASMVSMSTATEAATVATAGFNSALVSTGVGIFAVGVGLLIEKIIDFNKEFDATIEKIDHLKDAQDKIKPILKSGGETWSAYNNDKDLSKKQKSMLVTTAQSNYGIANDALLMSIMPDIASTKQKIAQLNEDKNIATKKSGQDYDGVHDWTQRVINDGYLLKDLTSHLSTLQTMPDYLRGIMKQSQTIITDYKQQGIKPGGYTAAGGKGFQENAYSTSSLAGAKGGLGEAKVISIHIDTMQKNNISLPEGIKNHASEAVQILIRAINNIAGSQGSTM